VNLTSTKKRFLITSGKRKTAIARAKVTEGKGRVRINKTPLDIYVPVIAREKIKEPLDVVADFSKNFDIDVEVKGGGFMGQAEASRIAIARALAKWPRSTKIKKALMAYDRTMLVGDPRRKEPKKYGGPGARRKKQKSYR
jgi:small subunit ribosomal protein S9